MQDYLIIARSGRSLAESAKRAGYSVHVLDSFADEDTCRFSASIKQLQYTENGFAENELIESIEDVLSEYPDAVVVTGSGFEIYPDLIDQIAQSATIYSNTAETIRLLKHPTTFFELLDSCDIKHPKTLITAPNNPDNYLVKKIASTGGEDVHWYNTFPNNNQQDYYFQEYIDGTVLSAVFLSNGNHSSIVGFNKQWQSSQFESMPFLYGGVCSLSEVTEQHYDVIKKSIDCLVGKTGLKGLCGIDYILTDDDEIYVLEVNPRPPASFELHEITTSLFDAHIASFKGDMKKYSPERCNGMRACAILYAEFELCIPPDFEWPVWVKDRPVAGARIKKYYPVCTIHAENDSWFDINRDIESRRKQIETQLARLAAKARIG